MPKGSSPLTSQSNNILNRMKKDYSRNINLRCIVCGDTHSFDYNEDKSYCKCVRCGREYYGGLDEVTMLNEELIHEELEDVGREALNDIEKELNKFFKKWK